jgi:hypothetical protein
MQWVSDIISRVIAKSLLIFFVDLVTGLSRSDARVEELQIATLADLARIQLAVTVLTLGC